MNISLFKCLSQTRTVGVSHTDTKPLRASHFHCIHHSEHSCDSAQPDTFLALLLSFNSQSLWAWRPFHSVQCCTVHLSHILRVIKRMFESQVWRNLQNVPCGQKKVFLSAERDIKQESIRMLHFLHLLVVHQTTKMTAVFGERVFSVFWWTGCKAWLTVFTITDKWHLGST